MTTEETQAWVRETRIWLHKAFPYGQKPAEIRVPKSVHDGLKRLLLDQNDNLGNCVQQTDGPIKFRDIPIVIDDVVKREATNG